MQFYALKNKQINTGMHPPGLSDIISALRMAPASILLTSLYSNHCVLNLYYINIIRSSHSNFTLNIYIFQYL